MTDWRIFILNTIWIVTIALRSLPNTFTILIQLPEVFLETRHRTLLITFINKLFKSLLFYMQLNKKYITWYHIFLLKLRHSHLFAFACSSSVIFSFIHLDNIFFLGHLSLKQNLFSLYFLDFSSSTSCVKHHIKEYFVLQSLWITPLLYKVVMSASFITSLCRVVPFAVVWFLLKLP